MKKFPFSSSLAFESFYLPVYPSFPIIDLLHPKAFIPLGGSISFQILLEYIYSNFIIHYFLPRCCIFILECFVICPEIRFMSFRDRVQKLSQNMNLLRLLNNPPTMTRHFLQLCIICDTCCSFLVVSHLVQLVLD